MTSEKRPAISASSLPDGIHVVKSFHRFNPKCIYVAVLFFFPLQLFIKSDCMLFSFRFSHILQQTDHKIRYAVVKWQNLRPHNIYNLKTSFFFLYKIENMIIFFLEWQTSQRGQK